MLEFIVREQKIMRVDSFEPAEKSMNYLLAKFTFKTDEWKGATKTAVFQNRKMKESIDTILQNDICLVPWEVLEAGGMCEVSVYGFCDGVRITTNKANFFNDYTLSGGSASRPPTPSVYEQLLAKMENIDGGTFEDWKEES